MSVENCLFFARLVYLNYVVEIVQLAVNLWLYLNMKTNLDCIADTGAHDNAPAYAVETRAVPDITCRDAAVTL